jgi:hypothetical protein
MTIESLIVAPKQVLSPYEINDAAKEAKKVALITASFVDHVTDAETKKVAVNAQIELKIVISAFEKDRKKMKEPLLKAGRQLDTLCATESLELVRELDRVTREVSLFDAIERSRVLEEERLQREELAKIEAEKQAELKRIADEQAAREAEAKRIQDEIDRKAREAREAELKREQVAREAAQSLVRAATNKMQREIAEAAARLVAERAEKNRVENEKREAAAKAELEKQDAALSLQRNNAAAASAAIEEKADDAAYCAAKPIAITTVARSRQSTNWKITVDQPFVLARHRPDLVNITPRLAEIKAALNNGETIQGITAVRETTSGVRLPPERKVIEV